MFLELGPGTAPHPRTVVGLDLHHPILSYPTDISHEPWPLEDESVDEIFASHVMEHIAKGEPIIHVMCEALRVLKPGGTFTMIMPLIGWTDPAGNGHPVHGWQPHADPTHLQFWWLPESLLYFCEGSVFKPKADYGMPVWGRLGPMLVASDATRQLDSQRRRPAAEPTFWAVREGWEGVARLVKP